MDAIYQSDVEQFGQMVADALYAVEASNWGFLLAGKGIVCKLWIAPKAPRSGDAELVRHVFGVNRHTGVVLTAASSGPGVYVDQGIPRTCIQVFAPDLIELRDVKIVDVDPIRPIASIPLLSARNSIKP